MTFLIYIIHLENHLENYDLKNCAFCCILTLNNHHENHSHNEYIHNEKIVSHKTSCIRRKLLTKSHKKEYRFHIENHCEKKNVPQPETNKTYICLTD